MSFNKFLINLKINFKINLNTELMVCESVGKQRTRYIKRACAMLCELSFAGSIYAVTSSENQSSKKHSAKLHQLPVGLIFAPKHCDEATILTNQIQQKTNYCASVDSVVLVPIPKAYALFSFLGCDGPQKIVEVQQSQFTWQPNIQILPDTSDDPFAPQIIFQFRATNNMPLGDAFCNGEPISPENNPVTQEIGAVSFSLLDLFHANATGNKLFYIFKTIEDKLAYCISLSLLQNSSSSSLFYQNIIQMEKNILHTLPEKFAKILALNNGNLFVGRDIPQKLNRLREQRQKDLMECMRILAGNDESVMEWNLKCCRICVGDEALQMDMKQINNLRRLYDKITQKKSACLLIFVLGSLLMELAQLNDAELSLNDIDACVTSIRNKMPKILQHSNLTNIYDEHVKREMMCNVRYTADGNWEVHMQKLKAEADALGDCAKAQHAFLQWLASKKAGEDQSGESGMCLFNVLQSLLGGSPYETFDDCETLFANFGFLLTSIFLMNSQAEFEILMRDCLQDLHMAFPNSLDAVIQYQKLASEIMRLGVAVYEQKSAQMHTKSRPEILTPEDIKQKIAKLFIIQESSPTWDLYNFINKHPNSTYATHLASILAASKSFTTDVSEMESDDQITHNDLSFSDYTRNWTSRMQKSDAHGPQGHACGLGLNELPFATLTVNGRSFELSLVKVRTVAEPTSHAKQCADHVTKLIFNGPLSELETKAKDIFDKKPEKLQFIALLQSLNLSSMFLANRAQVQLRKEKAKKIIGVSSQYYALNTGNPDVCDDSFYKTAIQCGDALCFTASKDVEDPDPNAILFGPGIALDLEIARSISLTVKPKVQEEENMLLYLLAKYRSAFAIKYAEMQNSPTLSLLTERVNVQSKDGLLFPLDAQDALNNDRMNSFTLHSADKLSIDDIASSMNEDKQFMGCSTKLMWNNRSCHVECLTKLL